jgi:hypothetical protein
MIDDKDRETPVRMFVRRVMPSDVAEAVQTMALEAAPGTYTVSFAISDGFSSETSYLQREVTVAK